MVDVLDILGEKKGIVNESIVEQIDYTKQTFDVLKELPNYVQVLDLAITRKIPFEKVTVDNQIGLYMVYSPKEFKRKIQKFGLKSNVKRFDTLLNTIEFDKIVNLVKENFDSYQEKSTRLLEWEGKIYLGINVKNNTILFNVSSEVTSFLLFNISDSNEFNLEKSLKIVEKEVVPVISNIPENVYIPKVSENELENEKEKTVDFAKELEGVDDLINKFKKKE